MKNINKHTLYKNIMLSISNIVKLKLNEDLLSNLDDDDDDDSDFVNYDENIIDLFKGKLDPMFMNNYDKVGDLLTYLNNLFYIIKNNKSINDIRRKLNTTRYGKIIGMCVGKGLWLSTEFDYTKRYIWATGNTILEDDTVKTTDDGWYNTTYIWNNYSDEISDTIWEVLYEREITGLGKHVCYLPSVKLLKEIYKNNNIILIEPYNWYWSSSLYFNDGYFTYNVYFSNGCVYSSSKNSSYHILTLLHFE